MGVEVDDGVVQLAQGGVAEESLQHVPVAHLHQRNCVGHAPVLPGNQQQGFGNGVAFAAEAARGVAPRRVYAVIQEVLNVPAHHQQTVFCRKEQKKEKEEFHSQMCLSLGQS